MASCTLLGQRLGWAMAVLFDFPRLARDALRARFAELRRAAELTLFMVTLRQPPPAYAVTVSDIPLYAAVAAAAAHTHAPKATRFSPRRPA